MVDYYEINSSTLLLIPIDLKKVKVVDLEKETIVNNNIKKIIDNSCKFFGSSLIGRQEGTKNMINVSVKAPIIIEESKNLIFFPTKSPREKDCIWISYNNLIKYIKNGQKVTLFFKNNIIIDLDISYYIIDNQITRCIKLEKELYKRKKCI